MGRRALGMGDQHDELQHTQHMHIVSSEEEEGDDEEEEEEEEEEKDGGTDRGVLADPYCVVIESQALGTGKEQVDDQESEESDRPLNGESAPGRFTREVMVGSSVGHKPKKRCSVLCTVYCVESDLSGEIPPMFTQQESRRLSDTPSRSSLHQPNAELALSPASLELELSPFLISSLGDANHKVVMSCRVCLEDKSIKPLPCCKKGVCEECLKRYLSSQVQLGQVEIKCPITECNKHLDESTVLYSLPHDDIIKYKYFLELSRTDSSTKPCPQCKHFTDFKRKSHIPTPTNSESKFKVSMCSQ